MKFFGLKARLKRWLFPSDQDVMAKGLKDLSERVGPNISITHVGDILRPKIKVDVNGMPDIKYAKPYTLHRADRGHVKHGEITEEPVVTADSVEIQVGDKIAHRDRSGKTVL